MAGALGIGRVRDRYRFWWARLRTPGTIVFSEVPQIDPPFTLRVAPGATVRLGRDVRFGAGFNASVDGSGVLEIGDHTAFNVNCWIGVTGKVSVGPGCLIGPLVVIVDGNHGFGSPGTPVRELPLQLREITIGRNVWVGAKATIINSIGDDAVIGAHSLVTHALPPGCMAIGTPARVVRTFGNGAAPAVSASDAASGR